ncbi:MAG: hypothetical protein WCI67_16590 [Chloroflexales bacterium]
MADHKPWCWEVGQSGPDWFFIACVAPGSERALAQIAVDAPLKGFTYCARADEHCRQHQRVCSYHTFIDARNATAYINNIEGRAKRNIWIYNTVEVHGDTIKIECGYGGRGDDYHRVETTWLLAVFATPGVTLRDWKVVAGGEGYDDKTIRAGVGLDDFRSYIA